MKNKTKYIAIALLILAVCSVGTYANAYWYNTSPCRAIDISLTDARVIDFLDRTNMATASVHNCKNYMGYNTWVVNWHTQTQSQRVYIDIYSGTIVGTGPEPEPCWHTVATFQGRHDKETPVFNIKGDTWRMNWEARGQEEYSAIFVDVYKEEVIMMQLTSFYECPGADIYCIYDGPGVYCLEVNTITLDYWSITVEDFY